MPVGVTVSKFGFGPLRIEFDLAPTWDRVAKEFPRVTAEVLRKEMNNLAGLMGEEMLRQIRIHALPHSYTGRLADTQRTWRYWITQTGARDLRLTVGLHRPADVPPSIGRPVRFYAHAVEFGGKPRYPLGKLARQRIKSWAAARGLTATQAHYIARAIYLHGTDAHPYFEPAARATVRMAEGWLEDAGKRWSDEVQIYFGGWAHFFR